jgi:hypothetical protein
VGCSTFKSCLWDIYEFFIIPAMTWSSSLFLHCFRCIFVDENRFLIGLGISSLPFTFLGKFFLRHDKDQY